MTRYQKRLLDPRWQKKRLEVMQRDGFKCCLCTDDGTALHIHHMSYKGNPWDVPNEELKTVCSHCHSVVHELKDTLVLKVFKYPMDEAGFFMILAYCEKTVAFMFHDSDGKVKLQCMVNYNTIAIIFNNMPEKYK